MSRTSYMKRAAKHRLAGTPCPHPPGGPLLQVNDRLTGFSHNAVTPVGMLERLPIVLSHRIAALQPALFWMGGGEVDLKLGLPLQASVLPRRRSSNSFFEPLRVWGLYVKVRGSGWWGGLLGGCEMHPRCSSACGYGCRCKSRLAQAVVTLQWALQALHLLCCRVAGRSGP